MKNAYVYVGVRLCMNRPEDQFPMFLPVSLLLKEKKKEKRKKIIKNKSININKMKNENKIILKNKKRKGREYDNMNISVCIYVCITNNSL